jgi:type IV pilus assembly protein PilA
MGIKNFKGFTLIELLVVVAIIGILAAVGVVAYNGYTGAAKKSASTSNHNTIVKYISTEIRKCDLGESSIMNNKVSCNEITVYNKIALAVAGPNGILNNLENPYNKGFNIKAGPNNSVNTGGTAGCNSAYEGNSWVDIRQSPKQIEVTTCPTSQTADRLFTIIDPS